MEVNVYTAEADVTHPLSNYVPVNNSHLIINQTQLNALLLGGTKILQNPVLVTKLNQFI